MMHTRWLFCFLHDRDIAMCLNRCGGVLIGSLISQLRRADEPAVLSLLLVAMTVGQDEPAAHCLPLSALDSEALLQLKPDLVVCPLFGAGPDATAVIERLQQLGYSGPIVVICPHLPKPKLVEAELRQLGPGQRLRLLMVDGAQDAGLSAR